jgi:hypothetical protein
MASLEVRKGDDHIIRGTVRGLTDQDHLVPVDITGWFIWFSIKRRYPDTDGQAVVSKVTGGDIVITDAPLGQFEITVRASDFANIPNAERTYMRYDVQVKTATLRINTLGDGDFVILGDITNTIS